MEDLPVSREVFESDPRRAFAREAYVEMQPTVGPQMNGWVDEWNSCDP
jgi:hypothetical protein